MFVQTRFFLLQKVARYPQVFQSGAGLAAWCYACEETDIQYVGSCIDTSMPGYCSTKEAIIRTVFIRCKNFFLDFFLWCVGVTQGAGVIGLYEAERECSQSDNGRGKPIPIQNCYRRDNSRF